MARSITKNDSAVKPHGCEVSLYADRPPLANIVLESLETAKAEDIVSIPLQGKTSEADFMVIASGRVGRHVVAIAERVVSDLKCSGHMLPVGVEGLQHGNWVLIDVGDVIIHVFRPEIRLFYNLEKMWDATGLVYQDVVDCV